VQAAAPLRKTATTSLPLSITDYPPSRASQLLILVIRCVGVP
jgi:hypothetical protein